MVKQRVITACALALTLLWAVLAWPQSWFIGLLSFVSLVCGWEWARLCGLRPTWQRGGYASVLALISLVALATPARDWPALYVAAFGTALWLAIVCYLSTRLGAGSKQHGVGAHSDTINFAFILLGLPIFAIAAWGLGWLMWGEYGSPGFFLYAFCIVWLADIGAWLAGRRYGKHKLAPHISPGKTREGMLGGLLAVALWALLWAWLDVFLAPAWALFVASMFAAVFAVFGDLFESLAKRRAGLKDSGAILPGHGGLLDRLDSLLAAVPIFVFSIAAGAAL